jgi:hypothetical protein
VHQMENRVPRSAGTGKGRRRHAGVVWKRARWRRRSRPRRQPPHGAASSAERPLPPDGILDVGSLTLRAALTPDSAWVSIKGTRTGRLVDKRERCCIIASSSRTRDGQ